MHDLAEGVTWSSWAGARRPDPGPCGGEPAVELMLPWVTTPFR
jgi:hypothetical protein